MRRAFVSHSTADDHYAAEMASLLRAMGFDEVFNDASSITPDEEFWPKIEEGIRSCDSLVVIITAASNGSEWVKREVEFARSLPRKVIPVWIEDCPIPSVLSGHDVIDFRPRTRQERRFDIGRIVKYAPADLIGREDETKLLNDAWEKVLRLEKGRPHVLTFVALGGEGKTSLVAKWAADLAAQDWPGCDAVFAWSFYSQGTRNQGAASSDIFFKAALEFFGDDEDKEFAISPDGAFEKGHLLARVVGQRRSLLILDGLEPLQYAPTSPMPGQLKDQDLAALLKGLATTSHGLCVVTTRYPLPDLKTFLGKTVREEKLARLSRAAGVDLLQRAGVIARAGALRRNIPLERHSDRGELVNEFEKLVEDVKGHALTLNLLGMYLRDFHAGDIRQRDRVQLREADAESEHPDHATHVLDAYVRALESGGRTEEDNVKGRRALAILSLLGLFDRPATVDCLSALWSGAAIAGLTDVLAGLGEGPRNRALQRLEAARLLTVNRAVATGELLALDAHPLLREYFARRLREGQPEAWKAGHRRLYEHICARTAEGDTPTLEDLQPLYHAVAHGCHAGLHQETYDEVYFTRIRKGNKYYSVRKLGAVSSDLGAAACFFSTPWNVVSSGLREVSQAGVLNAAASWLRALGRLTEALEPMRASGEIDVKAKRWKGAAQSYNNLSELEQTLGEVAQAERDAAQSVIYADYSGSEFHRLMSRTTRANALHHAGDRVEAAARFREAEQIQTESQPEYQLLYSVLGFQYCDLLLMDAERAGWKTICSGGLQLSRSSEKARALEEPIDIYRSPLQTCRAVSQRAAQTLAWAEMLGGQGGLLDPALDHLTLGRAALYAAILEGADVRLLTSDLSHLNVAVSGLRRANRSDHLPRGLQTRAWLRFLEGKLGGPDSAQSDLDEAWEIAERGAMKLFLADIHLHRARLFFRTRPYPFQNPDGSPRTATDDLDDAERLINACGYHRRDEELADAKAAILHP